MICGIGVAGVFLALYYSNISAVYSAQYANSPNRIRELFENEIANNESIKSINRYMILSILLLFLIIIGIKVWYVTVGIMIIETISIIINFILMGNRVYEFSDIYNVINTSSRKIIFHIDSASYEGYQYKNINFQDHHSKRSQNIMEDMELINDYALNEGVIPKKNSITNFLEMNLYILNYYFCKKNMIMFDSFWFRKDIEHKKWYRTDFSEKNIALITGTDLYPNFIQNLNWFENKILTVNNKSLEFLFKNQNIKEIIKYLNAVSLVMPNWIKYGDIEVLFSHIVFLSDKIKDLAINYPDRKSEDVCNLIEMLNYMYVHFVLEVKKYLDSINFNCLDKMERKSYKFNNKNFLKLNNKIINCEKFFHLYKGIRNEIYIEKKKITPKWYIEQIVAELYIKDINKTLRIIEKIYLQNINILEELFEKKCYTYHSLLVTNENELNNKIENLVNSLGSLIQIIQQKDIEKDYKLSAVYLSDFLKNIAEIHNDKIPIIWENCAKIWGLQEKHSTQEKDIFGFCYNNLCEFIFEKIICFDYEKFNEHYKELFNLAILSEIVISEEVSDISELNENARIQYQMSGLCMMFELSGYAIIVGEVLKDRRWKEVIDSVLETMFHKLGEKSIEKRTGELKRWIRIIDFFVNNIWAIGRMENYNRESRFNDTIEKSGKLKFEYIGQFGHKKIINTKMLSQIYYSDLDGISADMKEIYAIACLNEFVDEDDKYKSTKLRIKKWGEIADEKEE